MKLNVFYILFFISIYTFSQQKEDKSVIKSGELSKKYTYEGNVALKNDKPTQAEVDYRNAIAENTENVAAQYNLGTMYYKQKSYGEAFSRLKKASSLTTINSEDKHKVFHNLGNVFMKEKAYDRAVESYKEALRNNPSDEETRYNLAVAQDMLKKNPPQNNQNQNKENKENKEEQNNQDNKEKDQNKEKQDENKDENKNQNKDNQDNNKNQDKKQQDENQEKKQNEGGNEKNRPSSLSPQQMERILEAMNNEDQKTQEKINGIKAKGNRSKSEKDW